MTEREQVQATTNAIAEAAEAERQWFAAWAETATADEQEGPIAYELRKAAEWVVACDCDEHPKPGEMEAAMKRLRGAIEQIRQRERSA